MACGLVAVLIVFLFPLLDLYPLKAVPVLISLVMGIGLFITGTIFELKFVQLSSLVWWIGACIMAIVVGPYNFLIMAAMIVIGWIFPGFLLNKNYKTRSI